MENSVIWKKKGTAIVAKIGDKTFQVDRLPGSEKFFVSYQNEWSALSWTCIAATKTQQAGMKKAERYAKGNPAKDTAKD